MAALKDKGYGPKPSHVLAGLSGGALGIALGLDPARAVSVWDNVDSLFGLDNRAKFFKAALDWTATFSSEVEKIEKAEEDPMGKAHFMALILDSLRLWWRDVAVLAATGDVSALLGPPPSVSQKKRALKVTAREVGGLERAMAKLADGLNRSIRVGLVFEGYWVDVVQYL